MYLGMVTLNRVILPKMVWSDTRGRVPRDMSLGDINALEKGTNCTELRVILPGSVDRSFAEMLLTVSTLCSSQNRLKSRIW